MKGNFYIRFDSLEAFNDFVEKNPSFTQEYREADAEVMKQSGAIVWQKRLRGL